MNINSNAGKGIGSLSEPIDQLELVMADVESFLVDWLGRIEQLQAMSSKPDAHLRKRIRDFELEKSQWEAKRKRETQDIHEKAEELTKAWLHLEQEQRRFLQSRDSQSRDSQLKDSQSRASRPSAVEASSRLHAGEPPANEEQESPRSLPPAAVAPPESNPRRPSPLQGQRASATAAGQFEQLRREIESSRHQHRRV